MKRFLRILLIVVVVLAAVAVLGRLYLSSGQIRSKVITQLESVYGGTVTLDKVHIGISATSFSGLTLYEKDGQTTWLTAGHIDTDLTLMGLIRGNSQPRKATIRGAKVLVRLDRRGKVLTELPAQLFAAAPQGGAPKGGPPSALPDINLQQADVTVRQQGRADFTLHGLDGSLGKENGAQTLALHVDDSEWGKWTLSAHLDKDQTRARAELQTEQPLALSQEMLERVPLVPTEQLRQVHIGGGDVSVIAKLTYA